MYIIDGTQLNVYCKEYKPVKCVSVILDFSIPLNIAQITFYLTRILLFCLKLGGSKTDIFGEVHDKGTPLLQAPVFGPAGLT